MKKLIIFISLFYLLSGVQAQLFSQQKQLKGVVYGEEVTDHEHENEHNHKTPLAKATVVWLGTQSGTLTDKDGLFKLAFPEGGGKLVVSYTGYKKDTIEVKSNSEKLEIVLKAEFKTEDIVVVGRQPSQIISQSEISKTEILTQRSLTKAACCNLSESFQTNPSVDVNYTDAVTGAKQIELLGLHGAYSQLLTEKIPNLRGIAAPFGLGYVPGPWMHSIQISKGTSSVSTGFESITGQINVEFKKPRDSEPLYLNLYANQEGKVEGNLTSAAKLSDAVSTILLVHGDVLNNQIDNNHDGFLDHPMSNQINLFNRWEYVDEHTHAQAGVKALYENRMGGQKNFFPDKNANLYGIDIETERYEAYAKNGYILDHEHFKSIGLIANATTHRQDAFFGKNKYTGKQNSIYLNLIYEAEVGEEIGKGSVGLSYILDDYDEAFGAIDQSRTERIPGAYVEYTLSAIKDLHVTAGFRADFHNIHGNFYTPRLHLKYDFRPGWTVRASAGKGYRLANVFSDNLGYMASSRNFVIGNDLKPEEAWNYGVNTSYEFEMFELPFTLNAEFYRTDFKNQVIADIDRDYKYVYVSNLDGKSYSNSFQIDLSFEPLSGLELFAAYRLNDVWMTTNGKLQQKSLLSPQKGFLNIAYTTSDNGWKFDFTTSYSSSGRLPNSMPESAVNSNVSSFNGYFQLQGQITKTFGMFELYLGGENLTDYMQPYPVIGYANPFSTGFDSSLIWGPVSGRKIYMGMRYNL